MWGLRVVKLDQVFDDLALSHFLRHKKDQFSLIDWDLKDYLLTGDWLENIPI